MRQKMFQIWNKSVFVHNLFTIMKSSWDLWLLQRWMPRLLQMHCFLHLGANLASLVGHGYDGSSKNRVQAKIAKVFPNATYVYCQSHVLNLAISSRCTSVPSICNLLTQVHAFTWSLMGSAKRKEIFLEIASCNNSKDQQLLDFLKI